MRTTPRPKASRSRAGHLFLAGVVLLAACGGDDDSDAELSAVVTTPTTTASSATPTSIVESTVATTAVDPSPEAEAPSTTAVAEPTVTEPPECTSYDKLTEATVGESYIQTYIFIADMLEIWKKHCLDVQYVEMNSSAMTTLYVSGGFQFGQIGTGTSAAVLSNGLPMKLYAVPLIKSPYLFLVRDDINSLADLKGQPIGITGEGGGPHTAVKEYLRVNGEDPADYTFVALNSFANIVAAASAGQVAGVATGPPFSDELLGMGFKEMENFAELDDLFLPGGGQGGDPNWVEEHKDVAKRFLRASTEANWIFFTDKVAATDALIARAGYDASDTAEIDRAYQAASYLLRPPTEWGETPDDVWELFKTQSANPDQIETGLALKPDENLIQELAEEGWFEYLEATYGPLPERPTSSGLSSQAG